MFDFIGKLLFKRTPDEIVADDPQAINTTLTVDPAVEEDLAIAQGLMDHLNAIRDWRNRVDAIDYLSGQAAKSGGNPEYATTREDIANAIVTIGGSGNMVDFEMAKAALAIVFDMFDVMALSAIAGTNNA
jgi:hypothetical protein